MTTNATSKLLSSYLDQLKIQSDGLSTKQILSKTSIEQLKEILQIEIQIQQLNKDCDVMENNAIGLQESIKKMHALSEKIRNNRQEFQTMFENFDQKANQLYNLLSSVMKSMNEMRMGTIRDMLEE